MNLSKLFLILNLFLFNNASLTSDEWIKGSRFCQLVNYVGAYASARLDVEGLLPSDLGTGVRSEIIKRIPELRSRHELVSVSDSEFVDAVKEEVVGAAIDRSSVVLSNLVCANYEQKVVKDRIELRQMARGEGLIAPSGESVVRTYWRDRHSGVFYDLDKETKGSAVGYDPDKVREVLSISAGLIAGIITPVETDRIEQEYSTKYIGRARYTLDTCANLHPFHSGCIRKTLALDSRCPICRVDFTKKDLAYKPDYKKGESCVVCMDSIEPTSIAVATKNVGGRRGEKRTRS